MESTLIVLSIPIFLAFIGAELWIARRRGRRLYRFADSIANLGNGIGEQIIQAFCIPITVGVYVTVYAHARLTTLSTHSVVAWVVLFFALDFLYYAYHRASHRVNFLWAGHVVHHSSEEYNFSVALRQSWFGQQLTEWVFFLPLALAGFPPSMFVVTLTLNTLYQFFIHTRLVGTLGPLEWVMNTPSHHRVHHARNPEYIDRNYGAILIIWDRLFGTFAREDAKPVYGITKPFHSFNSLRAQLQPVIDVIATSLRAPRLAERLRVWLAPPERTFSWERATSSVPALDAAKFGVRVAPRLQRYIWINFGLVIAATFVLMMWSGSLPERKVVCGAMLILFALLSFGGLVEGRRWARPLELARVGITAVALVWLV